MIPTLLLLCGSRQIYPPANLTKVQQAVTLKSGKDRWLLESRTTERGNKDGRYYERLITAKHNGKLAWQESVEVDDPKYLPIGNFCDIGKPKVKAPFPVMVMRAQYGLGRHWDTLFYGLVKGKLVRLGRPPAMNSFGPVNYKGRSDLWLFDNEDFYEERDNPKFKLRYYLYRLTPEGQMRCLKSWNASANQKNLRDTVLIYSND